MHYIRTQRLGFGDIVEKFTKTTGIKSVVDAVSDVTGVDCGCPKRKENLNNPDLLINKILNNGNSKITTNESTTSNSI
jgi:hypothetical protein